MNPCSSCTHYYNADKWRKLCMRWPRDEVDPVTGEREPPYWPCRTIRPFMTIQGECQGFEEHNPKQMELGDGKET